VRLRTNVSSRAESLDHVRHLQLGITFCSMQFSSGSASALYPGEEVEAPRCITSQRAASISTPRRALNTCHQALCKASCRLYHWNRESLLTNIIVDNVVRTARRYHPRCGRHFCRLTCDQCVRPTRNTTCERCVRFKHHCDPGRLSNRGQQSTRRRSPHQDPGVQMIAVLGNAVQAAVGMYESPQVSDQESVSPYSGTTSISLESDGVSFRNPSLDSTPDMEEHLNLDYFPNFATDCSVSGTFLDVIEPPVHRWLQDSLEYGVEVMTNNEIRDNDTETLAMTEPILVPSQIRAKPCTNLTLNTHNWPELNNLRPSRLRPRTTFETRLENRIVRLWDSYEAFTLTDARPNVLAVTPLFAATFSELFRWSRQMAEDGVC
jgi:hypothetical protein